MQPDATLLRRERNRGTFGAWTNVLVLVWRSCPAHTLLKEPTLRVGEVLRADFRGHFFIFILADRHSLRSSCRGEVRNEATEADVQRGQAAQAGIGPPIQCRIQQSRARKPAQKRVKSNLTFHACQRRAETEMSRPAKRQMPVVRSK